MICKICRSQSKRFSQGTMLGKYPVSYYQCGSCGFVQTEEPHWLSEAYHSAINLSDVGLVRRNLMLSIQSTVIISTWFNRNRKFIDFGGGYGLFVRLMRDRGYNFYRFDAYCENLFARGFDAELEGKGQYELMTAFEVFEHLTDPLTEIEKMLSFTSSILFTTELLPAPVPLPQAWWYYGLDHGQHVSFYTPASLQAIADRFHLRLYRSGSSLHLLTSHRIMPYSFSLLSRYKMARLVDLILSHRSLMAEDYKAITGKDLY